MNRSLNMAQLLVYAEIVALGIFYVWSPHGIQAVRSLHVEQQALDLRYQRVAHDVKALEEEMARWTQEVFYKEKIAREQLQLIKPGDVVYCMKAEKKGNS